MGKFFQEEIEFEIFLELSIDQMAVLVDLLNHIPKSLIENEIISVRIFSLSLIDFLTFGVFSYYRS